MVNNIEHILFIGYRFVVESLNSVILGLTCAEKYISVEKAVSLTRLEEEFQVSLTITTPDSASQIKPLCKSTFMFLQTRRWGRIEWAHELSQQDTQARAAAGILFIHLNSSSSKTRSKAQRV